MFRRFILSFLLIIAASAVCFGQASALRDYVGIISQTFHPDVVSYMEDLKGEFEKRGYSAAAKSVDNYLKGETGTGFVYVANNGKNYILTNFHVISQAYTLSITFEKPDGDKTNYSDLRIVAVDEDMDIALLEFSGGQNPFRQGLTLLNRTLDEGEDVYSAGFPGLGTAMIWQFGRGMVSNSSVRIPYGDDSDKMIGPLIQHTAQIDPGNSGGPLLVQTQGVPTGYAVAGINTLSARYRQAANFSIPTSRVQSFLNTNLGAQREDPLAKLNTRIASFIEGLDSLNAVYTHIASFLSNTAVGENAEYALDDMLDRASRSTQDNIVSTFVYSPVDGMAYAVAWTIEDALRSGSRRINISVKSTTEVSADRYTVSFDVNGKTISSDWVNEYGVWRIRTFGDFAAGDKSLVETRQREREAARQRAAASGFDSRAAVSLVYDLEGKQLLVGVDLRIGFNNYVSVGMQGFFGKDFTQAEAVLGLTIPIIAGKVVFIPFADVSAGLRFPALSSPDSGLGAGFSIKGGLMFRPIATSGFFAQAAFQYSFYTIETGSSRPRNKEEIQTPMLLFGVGFAF